MGSRSPIEFSDNRALMSTVTPQRNTAVCERMNLKTQGVLIHLISMALLVKQEQQSHEACKLCSQAA